MRFWRNRRAARLPRSISLSAVTRTQPRRFHYAHRQGTDYANGQLIETTNDYLAISTRTNSVYYFGEAATQYQNGQVVGHSGSWESGVNGAHFGMLMPGTVLFWGSIPTRSRSRNRSRP